MGKGDKLKFINREISWLSFNERVLQEADDEVNPVIERLRFLGIFSNNRDEFFRVRVATVKRMLTLSKKERTSLHVQPEELLEEIQKINVKHEAKFKKVHRKVMKDLEAQRIFFINEKQLTPNQEEQVAKYFSQKVRPALVPLMLDAKKKFPPLVDKATYLAVKLVKKAKKPQINYALIEIPSEILSRFYVLPVEEGNKYIIMLDDVIRYGLKQIFQIFEVDELHAHTFKLTRDAELDIDDDVSESTLEKLEKSLKKRKKADPVRFVYDETMPRDMLDFVMDKLKIAGHSNLIAGGRYHNFKDFISFPDIGARHLRFTSFPPLKHPALRGQKSLLAVLENKDIMLSYPYQSFNYTIDILREAAIDPFVSSIKINLYRVARSSMVVNTLINAAKNGKSVTAIVELRARFDEQHNIHVSQKLQENGVKVIFGLESLKVHSKLILITRKEGRKTKRFAHVGTGNFHEGTARVYGDCSLWTADQRITNEVYKVFQFFKNNYKRGQYRHLIISPFNVRRNFTALIANEIKNAKAGNNAYIILKLNNLVDEEMIKKLYQASEAGVKVKLIVRGICSLIPGVKGQSENIEVISILDRFLEHARILVFCNNDEPRYYISSADWMERNLDRRVEVTVPIYDKALQQELQDMLDMQFADNVKARILDKKQKNEYVDKGSSRDRRSQYELYKYFRSKLSDT